MNCETNFASEYAPKPPWPTGFEESRIPQPNPEELQFKGIKIWAFLLVFQHFPLELSQIARILLPLNCNFTGLGWGILDFSKPLGQVGFRAHFEAKLVSQFMQTKFLCHKLSQSSTVFSVSYSRDCISWQIYPLLDFASFPKCYQLYVFEIRIILRISAKKLGLEAFFPSKHSSCFVFSLRARP